jgi:GH35 family endo-1,4-beta-xylanase
MKTKFTLLMLFCLICSSKGLSQNSKNVMSESYYNIWNEQVQNKINAEIEKNRKSNAVLKFENLPIGSQIKVEQISHDFLFGGNIFLFGDCGSAEKNKKYEDTFGDLFNAATVPFYWKTLEPVKGKPRFETGSSYEYRRPPTDPVVEFCESKGINMNGHAIIYGQPQWGPPIWMPDNRKEMEPYFEDHIRDLAERYKGRVQRWDVVNEPTDQANRGLMPDDYTYKSFLWAMKYFPDSVFLNINDSDMHWDMTLYRRYLEIVRNLIDRGIGIDQVGLQMHIFNPEESKKIANGADILTPGKIYERLDLMSDAGKPLHVSEVTVSAPDDSEAGKQIQAEITKNLYRLWFSYPNVMGITWWNVVDGGAAPGEPSFSGIYDKELKPKPVYFLLDELINKEWKTKTTLKASKDGLVKFRGFKGRYVVSWKDKSGKMNQREFDLLKDGDGFEM